MQSRLLYVNPKSKKSLPRAVFGYFMRGCDPGGEWVRGNVHTNSIENYWSLFKRGLIGNFHQVSVKRVERYMAEFDYRFNNRKDVDIFIKTIARGVGSREPTLHHG